MTRALAALVLLGATSWPPAHAQAPSGSGVFKTTSYCLQGITRSGTQTRPGVIAVDPEWIPLGSTVRIEGLSRTYVAEDTGGGVRGFHLDLWQSDCNSALEWGVQYLSAEWWP
jgi:3D (Asp-Asp-Asp) domain-containing protein